MKKIIVLLMVFQMGVFVFAGGESEGAATATHGKYLAGQGIIVPPDDVYINGYIAQIDYNYALPEKDEFEVYLYHGNRQLSNQGQDEILHIGIKAAKTRFSDLPPLNLAFVIDTSGSMGGNDKLGWVKESFEIFINKVRDIDFVSLISFNSESQVVFSSTRIDSQEKRDQLLKAVMRMIPGGGTNLTAGLQDGYAQVFANYREEYNNRVLFLTDGVGDNTGILNMAENYLGMGINVSTIGVGSNFDVNLMVELAKRGGGSSRFISDRDEMKKTFGDELDRMIVPAARDLKMRLEVPEWITIMDTWGYRNEKSDHNVTYNLPTLHNGDYETILTEIRINPVNMTGTHTIGNFYVEYETLDGQKLEKGPYKIEAELVKTNSPVYGASDYTVLQSSTMLYIARSMIEIGEIYYQNQEKLGMVNDLRYQYWNKLTEEELKAIEDEQTSFNQINSDQITKLEKEIKNSFKAAMDRTLETRKVVLNNKSRIDNIGFEDELTILDNYIKILGGELELNEERINSLTDNIEIPSPVPERNVNEHLENLFQEINLSLQLEMVSTIMLAPFLQQNNKTSVFTGLVNEWAVNVLSKNSKLALLDRKSLEQILTEQKLSLSGLIDTGKAIEVGRLLSAQYLITGTVIPMTNTAVVFARVINIESSEVETVSQVIVPMSDDLLAMLKL